MASTRCWWSTTRPRTGRGSGWLRSPPGPHVDLDDNRGGAGGFHAGLPGRDRGADLVWLMDDDGIPEPDCLKVLLEARGLRLLGPGRPGRAGPFRLCFPIRLPGRATWSTGWPRSIRRAKRVIPDVVIPFNGVLVTRDLVERIGTPREEFFVWGTTSSTSGGPAGRRPHRHRRRRPVPPPGHRRPGHAHGVRPHDVQPQPQRPQALLHGSQQPGQPARLPRLARGAGVRGQDGLVLLFTRPEPAAAHERPRHVRRPARRLHRPPEVPLR